MFPSYASSLFFCGEVTDILMQEVGCGGGGQCSYCCTREGVRACYRSGGARVPYLACSGFLHLVMPTRLTCWVCPLPSHSLVITSPLLSQFVSVSSFTFHLASIMLFLIWEVWTVWVVFKCNWVHFVRHYNDHTKCTQMDTTRAH